MAFKKVTYQTDKDSARINTVEPIRSKEDIKRIIQYFDSKNWHKYAVIFELGIKTGLRISDILGLKVYEVKNKASLSLREQKTGKVKEFDLRPEVVKLLQDWVKNLPDDAWVFEGRKNCKLDRSQVYRRINDACLDLDIDANVGTHTLRKTFGYHHYKHFKDVVILQKIFNHTSPDVTLRYIGITQEEINKSYLALDFERDPEDLEKIELGNSRITLRRVAAFCRTYIKSGGKIHEPFANMILELIYENRARKY